MKKIDNFLVKYVMFVLLNLISLVCYGFEIIPFFIVVSVLLISIVLVMALIMLQKQINELKKLLALLNLLERSEEWL